MKILKNLSIGIGTIIAILIALTFSLSAGMHFKRSIIIETEPSKIYKMVNNYRRLNEWSPWFALDPNAEYIYTGPKSGAGSRMKWNSEVSEVGSGEQWIVESKKNQYVKHGLDFGMTGVHTNEFILEDTFDGTKVTWAYTGDVSGTDITNVAIGKFFGAFFMDSMLGEHYEKGLASLKEIVENEPPVDELRKLRSHYGMYY